MSNHVCTNFELTPKATKKSDTFFRKKSQISIFKFIRWAFVWEKRSRRTQWCKNYRTKREQSTEPLNTLKYNVPRGGSFFVSFVFPIMFKLYLTVFLSSFRLTTETPLTEEVINGNSAAVLAMIESDPWLVNVADNTGKTPLINSAFLGKPQHTEIVRILLSKSAEVNRFDRYTQTALHYASAKGFIDIVKMLIKARASVNQNDTIGQTALIRAADGGHTEVVEILIANNADVTLVDQNGDTPLTLAALRGYTEIVKILIRQKADLNHTDRLGNTILFLASTKSKINVIKTLINSRANMDRVNDFGNSALTWAVDKNLTDVVDVLVFHEADVSKRLERKLVQQAISKRGEVLKKKSEFIEFSSFAKTLPDKNGPVVETVEEIIKSANCG